MRPKIANFRKNQKIIKQFLWRHNDVIRASKNFFGYFKTKIYPRCLKRVVDHLSTPFGSRDIVLTIRVPKRRATVYILLYITRKSFGRFAKFRWRHSATPYRSQSQFFDGKLLYMGLGHQKFVILDQIRVKMAFLEEKHSYLILTP